MKSVGSANENYCNNKLKLQKRLKIFNQIPFQVKILLGKQIVEVYKV